MPDLQVLFLTNGVPQPHADLNITLDSAGNYVDGPAFVSDTNRAVQDLLRGLLTVQGTNFLAPNYGTILSTLLNSRQLADVSTNISTQIRTILGYLGQFNINDPLSEQITNIITLQATETPSVINISLTVQTGGGTPVTVSI